MIVYEEISLVDFPFWGPAESRIKYLTDNDFERIEQELAYKYENQPGINKTNLNDLFSYEEDYIAQILGYNDFNELVEERSNE